MADSDSRAENDKSLSSDVVKGSREFREGTDLFLDGPIEPAPADTPITAPQALLGVPAEPVAQETPPDD